MDNKVKFLRGTAAEYESSTKDNDTFYYTTDDEKLYLGNKEITGGGVTIDNTLSDTSKNPVQNKVINAALNGKAELSDIPTSLPADGGNADTSNYVRTMTLIGTNETYCAYSSILDWAANTSGGNAWAFVISTYGFPTDAPIQNCEAVVSLECDTSTSRKYIEWKQYGDVSPKVYKRCVYGTNWHGDWFNVADGGNAATVNGRHSGRIPTQDASGNYWNENSTNENDAFIQWDGSTYFKLKTVGGNLTMVDNADTLDGKHASDFVQNILNLNHHFSMVYGDHAYITNVIDNNVPNIPIVSNYTHIIDCSDNGEVETALSIGVDYTKNVYVYRKNDGIWKNIADGGNADTLDGLHESSFAQNIGVWNEGDIKDLLLACQKSGFVWIQPGVTGMPNDGTYWFGIADCHTVHRQLIVRDIQNSVSYCMRWNNGTQTWISWRNLADGGNAATVNGLTVQTAVPANAKFTDTTYGAATASTTGLVTTGAQTLAGNKTFNGQVIPAGASAVGTAQARKIYAGTSDMTAGTTKLETGAIYLVYE